MTNFKQIVAIFSNCQFYSSLCSIHERNFGTKVPPFLLKSKTKSNKQSYINMKRQVGMWNRFLSRKRKIIKLSRKMDLKEENGLVPQFVGHGLLVSRGKNGRFVWFRLLHGSLVFSPNSPNFPRSVNLISAAEQCLRA